jgi:hypothetical protein
VSFVSVDFVTDSDTIADDAVDYLRAAMPGWEPADGNLEVWILQAVARQVAELTAVAADVPAAIFRQFGTQLVGLAPQAGARATLTSFWTARDNLGYTIPAGTQVAYRVTGDDLIVFEVVGDTVITPGATTLSGVALQATDVGTAWNAVPTGPLELVDALSWVESVTASTVSAGGLDAETDDAYLDRLADDLRLLTPRPILPDDFATLARNVTGVYRALAINGYEPGHERGAAGRRHRLSDGRHLHPHLLGADHRRHRLQRFGQRGAVGARGAVEHRGLRRRRHGRPATGDAVQVEFIGALSGTNVAQMTHTDSLTGGRRQRWRSPPPRPGRRGRRERAVRDGRPGRLGRRPLLGHRPGGGRQPTSTASARSAFVATATPTYTSIAVAYTVKVATGYVAADVQAACDTAVTAYLSPATWGGGDATPPVWRTGEDKVRVGELYAALYRCRGWRTCPR